MGDDGFALIELMLALAIIALLAALALPSARRDTNAAALRYQTQRVVAFLRMDRNAALSSGSVTTTVIDLANRRLRSGATGAMLELPPRTPLAARPSDLQTFRFYADGRASGGALLLGDRRQGLLIHVNPQTAAVLVEEPAR